MKLSAKTAWLACAVCIGTITTSQATTTFDFTDGGTPYTETGAGNFGNALDFGDLIATAWATTGVPHNANSLLNSAQLGQWPTGLGVCNRSEGLEGSGCSEITEHQVDNLGDDDYVLFTFDTLVQFEEIRIDPFFFADRDVSYWVGTIVSSDLTGLDPVALDPPGTTLFGDPIFVNLSAGSNPIDISLGSLVGNALLFSARADPGDSILHDNDKFKIASLTVTPVPVPAAVWLFGSGLVGLAGIARRRNS